MDQEDPPAEPERPHFPSGKARSAPPLTKLNRPGRPPSDPRIEEDGPTGPEPTRYNDWERKGRVSDF